MKNLILLTIIISTTSCSYFSGPEGMFPSTKENFLEEKVAKDINLPPELNLKSKENHYPVVKNFEVLENSAIPKPRQIFSSSGNSSVQLRRLGELMWIYVETLPSTSWPISKSYWETSDYEIITTNPVTGEIDINLDSSSKLKMTIEHGIKEASTEIFLLQLDKETNNIVSNPELIQSELSSLVNYFAETVGQFSGTSLAAQNLNDLKKAKIFVENGRTVIELGLSYERAWSSVSKAIEAANIVTNDKNRSEGIFYVSQAVEEKDGFFSFFSRRSNNNDKTNFKDSDFQVKITKKNNKTYVRAYSKDGKIEDAESIISKINESLS
jgi:outer membrane protein assembly factor BamC|tara:strand:+ start:7064 stop:8038 length:975 start_codon:yes stop_codon:yes gene_type:complete